MPAREQRQPLYVCGITPYDATHLGHAATYLAYDTLVRVWLDAGYRRRTTRRTRRMWMTRSSSGQSRRASPWQELAAQQLDLFRRDMEALSVIPPDHFVAVTEMIEPTAEAVLRLVDMGIALSTSMTTTTLTARPPQPRHPGPSAKRVGLIDATMLELAAERGGDPLREGKRDPLDPLLWRAARDGEPSWPSVLGEGRPGWHIECSVIANAFLEIPLTVQRRGIRPRLPAPRIHRGTHCSTHRSRARACLLARGNGLLSRAPR